MPVLRRNIKRSMTVSKHTSRGGGRGRPPCQNLILAVLLLPALLMLAGCAGSGKSSGLFGSSAKPATLPEGIPHRVWVAPFTGEAALTKATAARFGDGLLQLGFEPVTPGEANRITQIIKSGELARLDSLALDEIAQSGVEGVFVGEIKADINGNRAFAALRVELIRLADQQVVWICEVGDPRWWSRDLNPAPSALRAVNEALQILRKDLKKAAKGK